MRIRSILPAALAAAASLQCETRPSPVPDFSAVSRVDSGKAVAVMLTAYSTTLRANGTDWTKLRVAETDSLSREIRSARDTIQIYVTGNGKITSPDGVDLPLQADSAGKPHVTVAPVNGFATAGFRAGTRPDRVRIEARSGSLFPGGHEIHTIPASVKLDTPTEDQLPPTTKTIRPMIGADISWLPEIENRAGRFASGSGKFFENGKQVDAITLLKQHGFNAIRLRIFVRPENPKGYSPKQGFCGLDSTMSMARRVKAAGLQLLLDFHYSDYWADPQQQNKPLAWAHAGYAALKDSVRNYTTRVLRALQRQGTLPDMVQIGNEVNHGILWPDGHISNLDQLAGLLRAGVAGVEAVNPKLPVMMHLALGGQNDEARFWLDNMLARGLTFDVIGLSYYPRWHGTLEDLDHNLHDLVERYHKPVMVVEYSDFQRQVNDLVFGLPNGMGKGTAIWEPLGWFGGELFDRADNVTEAIRVYDELHARYLAPAGRSP